MAALKVHASLPGACLRTFIRRKAAVNMHPVSEYKGADLSEQQALPCLLIHTRPHYMQLECTRLALQLSTDVQWFLHAAHADGRPASALRAAILSCYPQLYKQEQGPPAISSLSWHDAFECTVPIVLA